MNLTVSPINFNGKWECVSVSKTIRKEESKYILKQRIYHPFKDETEAEIKKAVSAYPSGWSYGIWQLHPNARQRNKGDITELYMASVGDPISPDEKNDYTEHAKRLAIDNVTTDKQTFIDNHNNDHFRIFDVIKLGNEDAARIINEHFSSEQ